MNPPPVHLAPIFVAGLPGDLGGANTECWHTIRLWRRAGLDVNVLPTWTPDEHWVNRLRSVGCRVVSARPDRLADVPGLPGAVTVSFCNSRFLRHAEEFRRLGCRIVWVNCMNWLFAEERLHYRRHGPFDAYVFQSRYQQSQLLPQLRRYGVRPQQCRLIRGAFCADDFPFLPRPHTPGTPLVIGRISRSAPDKFAADTWSVYGGARSPIQARVLGWDRQIEAKLGVPPHWAECLPAGVLPPVDFYRSLHVMVQLGGGAEENWPRSALEAMAAGVPVVAENRGGWREVIQDGQTGLLCNTRAEIIAAIERLAEDEPLRLGIARRARTRLTEVLADPETIGNGWSRVFADCGRGRESFFHVGRRRPLPTVAFCPADMEKRLPTPLGILKRRYPWPERIPDVPPDGHGWFQSSNARVLSRYLGPETRLVVELGSWLGMSSRFILEHAPAATLVAIDHWQGSPEHHRPERTDVRDKLPRLYETFLRNGWPWRDRLVPMRTTTAAGMRELAALGLAPELIYVDAGHDLRGVLIDLRMAIALFPQARLVGDDYATFPGVRDGVRDGVRRIARARRMRLEVDENAWILHKAAGPPARAVLPHPGENSLPLVAKRRDKVHAPRAWQYKESP
ncbi:MAG: glycosyltransferase [Rhodopirellula sp.]|nr:glycosyltransferase [Rhodopirellula sp.]